MRTVCRSGSKSSLLFSWGGIERQTILYLRNGQEVRKARAGPHESDLHLAGVRVTAASGAGRALPGIPPSLIFRAADCCPALSRPRVPEARVERSTSTGSAQACGRPPKAPPDSRVMSKSDSGAGTERRFTRKTLANRHARAGPQRRRLRFQCASSDSKQPRSSQALQRTPGGR